MSFEEIVDDGRTHGWTDARTDIHANQCLFNVCWAQLKTLQPALSGKPQQGKPQILHKIESPGDDSSRLLQTKYILRTIVMNVKLTDQSLSGLVPFHLGTISFLNLTIKWNNQATAIQLDIFLSWKPDQHWQESNPIQEGTQDYWHIAQTSWLHGQPDFSLGCCHPAQLTTHHSAAYCLTLYLVIQHDIVRGLQ